MSTYTGKVVYRKYPRFKEWKGVTLYQGVAGSGKVTAASIHLSKVLPSNGTILTNNPSELSAFPLNSKKDYTYIPLELEALAPSLKRADAWVVIADAWVVIGVEKFCGRGATSTKRNRLFSYMMGMHRKFTDYVILTSMDISMLDLRLKKSVDNLVRCYVVDGKLLEIDRVNLRSKKKVQYRYRINL